MNTVPETVVPAVKKEVAGLLHDLATTVSILASEDGRYPANTLSGQLTFATDFVDPVQLYRALRSVADELWAGASNE